MFIFAASKIRYEITRGNTGGAFAVKNETGAIYVAGPLDYELRKEVSKENWFLEMFFELQAQIQRKRGWDYRISMARADVMCVGYLIQRALDRICQFSFLTLARP